MATGQGARNSYIQTSNSARAGQLGNSNLTENLSYIAERHTPIGIMVCVNQQGQVFPPFQEGFIAQVIGCTFEDGRAGDYNTNQTLDNTGQMVGVNVFGGTYIIAEQNIPVGTSPYIRHTISDNGAVVGAVRADDDAGKATKNTNFVVRAMSADGKAAYIVQKTIQL
jgi:hypothetical protein